MVNDNDSTELVVGLINGNGKLLTFQSLNEFLNGKKSLPILNKYAGKKLFNILVDDLGVIRYVDNKLTLTTILQLSPHNTAMRLLGKIAEAVIVRRCNEDGIINKKWFSLARRKNARIDTAKKFQALGTGLKKTKTIWAQRYNPSNPQRDIIWVDFKKGVVANMAGSTQLAGLEAGLQVKVSGDGRSYLLNDLYSARYEVPVVYFDMNHDFDVVAGKLIEFKQKRDESRVLINRDLISARAIDFDAFQEVYYYVGLVSALLDGRIKPEDLVNEAEKHSSFMNAIFSVGLENCGIGTKIFIWKLKVRLMNKINDTDEIVGFLSQYLLEDVLSGIIEIQILLYDYCLC